MPTELLRQLYERNEALARSIERTQESQEWLAATLKSIGDAVIATSADTNPSVVFMNAVAEKLTGWRFDEAEGRPAADVFRIIDYETRLPAKSPILSVLKGMHVTALANHTVLISRTGSEYVIEDSAAPIVDARGVVSGVVLVFRDTTAQELARKLTIEAKAAIENERENFRMLFRQIPEMVCILSGPDHVFEFVNEAHAFALGFDATGLTVRAAQPESVEVHGILDEVYRTGVTASLKEIPVTVGVKLRYFNLTYAPRKNSIDEVNGVMILGSEITHQVEAREAIIRAKEDADAANNSKTAFIANMSHEIRTPIGVIIGFCELLQDQHLSLDVRQDYLARVIKNTKGLTRIIDDILDLAKVEAGKLEVEVIKFSLFDLMNEAVELFQDRAKQKHITLALRFESIVSPYIHSDPTRIRQILINIIGNAIKFTSEGGVTVSVSSEQDQSGEIKVEIRVKDTGIGLTKNQMDKIFQPFVQADGSTNRLFGGTGLGLVISRRLALALGGTIDIEESRQREGCTFLITLIDAIKGHSTLGSEWLQKVATPLVKSPSERTLALHAFNILVAEDSIDNQMLVKRILTKEGANIDIAHNGEEAIFKAQATAYDLILMDVQMPKVDGYEATRSLRKAGFTTPIIALTAHAMLEEKERTREAGCNAHLTKPINAPLLVETIKNLIKT